MITLRTVTSLSEIPAITEFWTKHVTQSSLFPRYYGYVVEGRSNIVSPYIIVASSMDEIVGLLVGRIEYQPLEFRIGYAKLASLSHRTLTVLSDGVIGAHSADVINLYLDHIERLLSKSSLHSVHFEYVQQTSLLDTLLRSRFRRSAICLKDGVTKRWRLNLPKTFDSYLAQKSKKRRYWLNRLPRVLDREFPSGWSINEYTTPDDAGTFAQQAEEVAKHTYHRRLGVGFVASPEILVRLESEAQGNILRGYVLLIEGKPRAFWHCAAHQDVLHLSSTGYDPNFAAYEVGTVLLMHVIRRNSGTNIKFIDFGPGDAKYKEQIADHFIMESSILIFGGSAACRALQFFHRGNRCMNRLLVGVSNRLGLTQRVKTLWRRKKLLD